MRIISAAAIIGLLLLVLIAAGPSTALSSPATLTIDLGKGVSMEMVLVHAGSFMMGSERGEEVEKPIHKVNLTKPFYLGKFEVTQEQWQAVMGENPSDFNGPKHPVEKVSWEDCQAFLQQLSKKLPGRTFNLPTEAQWEYACRAGENNEFTFGNDASRLGDHAWFLDNSAGVTHPVGQKKPNAWGLYDMHGNVCEWCADWYGAYPPGEVTDPTGPSNGEARVLRGESFVGVANELRTANRVATPAYYRNSHVGMRLVLSVGAND